jgi:hypothetical protein
MIEFCSEYFLINDNGIDLLRSRFPYKHINYSEIHSTRIFNGYLLKNRFLPLIAGIIFILLSSKLLFPSVEILIERSNSLVHIHGRGLAGILSIPLTLMGFGFYFIVQSFKKSKILMIVTETGNINIRIKELEETNKIYELIEFLNCKLLREVEYI